MEDRMLVSVGMEYSQRTMEVWEDVVEALLATLSGKSSTGQKHILEQFAAYVKTGGILKAVRFDEEHLADFHTAARELGMMYYAVRDVRTKQAVIIFRDCDTAKLNQVAENLAKRGRLLYPNPQLSVSEFLEKNEKEEVMFCRAESLEKIEAAKWEAANRKMEFAVGKQQDGSYIVIFRKEKCKQPSVEKRISLSARKAVERIFLEPEFLLINHRRSPCRSDSAVYRKSGRENKR